MTSETGESVSAYIERLIGKDAKRAQKATLKRQGVVTSQRQNVTTL